MKGCTAMKGGGIWIKQSWVLLEVEIKAKGGIQMTPLIVSFFSTFFGFSPS